MITTVDAEKLELLAANDALAARLAEAHALADRIIKRNQGGYIGDHNDVLRICEITAVSASGGE